MLWRWLEPAIRSVEGGNVDTETFEAAYFGKYETQLRAAESVLEWPAEKQATAYGIYQILGENLARHHGLGVEHLDRFLSDERMQYSIARAQFYKMVNTLIKRRGRAWANYLFSTWNGGINHVPDYDRAIRRALKGKP
jgi:hypothetical protein